MSAPLLRGLRVIELATGVAPGYCGKVLAELGAEVIKVEGLPAGDELRTVGPFIGPGTDSERSAGFIYYNAGKQSVALNSDDATDRIRLEQLAATADVLLLDSANKETKLPPEWGGITVTFVGSAHPDRQDYLVTDLVGYALGGYLYTDGAAERQPLKGGGAQPEHTAGNYAVLAILALLFGRQGKAAARADLSVPTVECMATMHWYTTVMWTYAGLKKQRIGNRLDITHPVSLYRCMDGWVAIGAGGDESWSRIALILGRPELAEDPRYATGSSRLDHADEVDAFITEYTSAHTRAKVMATLQELRVACGLVSTPGDLLADPQYRARDYWTPVAVPPNEQYEIPGPPFKSASINFQVGRAPRLGEHTDQVLASLRDHDATDRDGRWRSAG